MISFFQRLKFIYLAVIFLVSKNSVFLIYDGNYNFNIQELLSTASCLMI